MLRVRKIEPEGSFEYFTANVRSKNFWIGSDDNFCIKLCHQRQRQLELLQSQTEVLKLTALSIPKKIHFVWLGGHLRKEHEKIIESWKLYHDVNAEWEIKIWTDCDLSWFTEQTMSALSCAWNYGVKSDILRYEILSRIGGVYVDIDYECLHSFDDLCCSCSFFAGASNSTVLELNNGIMGCCQHHPLINSLWENACEGIEEFTKSRYAFRFQGIFEFLSASDASAAKETLSSPSDMDTIRLTGPGLLTKMFYSFMQLDELHKTDKGCAEDCSTDGRTECAKPTCKKFQSCSNLDIFLDTTVALPTAAFHSIPNSIRVDLSDTTTRESLKTEHVEADSYCVHWWQRSWQAKHI